VILVSLAQGLDHDIRTRLSRLGTNFVIVVPGAVSLGSASAFGPPVLRGILTTSDADAVSRVAGVESASGLLAYQLASIRFKKYNASATVTGVDADTFSKFVAAGYDQGKFFNKGDKSSAVIGYNIANNYFNEKVQVGNQIFINGMPFRVEGIISKVGQGAGNLDNVIAIDQDAAREAFPGVISKDRVSEILAITKDGSDADSIGNEIKTTLANKHKVKLDKPDFTVMTAASIMAQVSQITDLLTLFMGAIAAISLVVGSIGIANSMFTSVLERTRDIGILKSVGAPNSAVLTLFLAESVMLSVIGGSVGVAIGVLAAWLISALGGISTLVGPELIAGSFMVAVAVGGVSGYFPARQASKLPAIVALRRE
ncbi:MAG TPA: FtsX-like permease family protein, partial [Candidatus Micrarchaeota archaeon]|nr:FtsX-like permease family protein [Candidatus Micrarchaeota archaeon]